MEKRKGSPAMMVAIYSRDPDNLLLIKNLLLPDPSWKFIGEELEEGESVIGAVVRALWEEGAFMLRRLDDPDVQISEVRPPITLLGLHPHLQYFYKVRLPYPRLRDLSGKKFPGKDADEFFETGAFPFSKVAGMPTFFKLHRSLYKEFLGHAV